MEVILAVAVGFFLGVLIVFMFIIIYGQWVTKPRDTNDEFNNPPGGVDNPWWGFYDDMDDEEEEQR